MHAPDGILNAGTAVATGALSVGAIAVSLRRSRQVLQDRQIPLAGLAAAFVFAAQMFNFPVAAGTTGHLLGGALAAILLGPWLGATVVTVVVVVQALAFADGGITALGYNVLNMAVVTSFGGYGVFRLLRRLLPANATGVVAATGIAAGVSVVLSAAAFALEWLFGATTSVPFDTVFGAMVGVHTLIGIGEGMISGVAVGAVLAARPDLVHGAADLGRAALARRTRTPVRVFVVAAAAVVLVLATVVSQLSGSAPDALERVSDEYGITTTSPSHPLAGSVFADYATAGLRDERLSLAVAGAAGIALVAAVGSGLLLAIGDRRRGRPERPVP